ncbi:hypothetical protein K466DRAFT_589320 [Polyporus arcularius HHB13444]|uniref:Uncharacterized protein n=1 Tax=Polyporus arcularius HHB13444 TaxID=1314778 RepID=A0A5C3P6T5_9APHY|nr:hypothetical protein K466DRAFT_589320 [Polyporus arcularius HHB13444]
MREGPPGGSSISERLAQLAEYENTWKTGTIPTGQRPSPDYSDAGGLFVNLDYDQSQLVIRRPASFFSGVPEKAWIVDLSQLPEQGGPELELLPSCSYAVDIAQDLLVLMVLPQDDEEYPDCYALSLSGDGETHPLAAYRNFYDGSILGLSNPQADIEIFGDLVGCTVVGMDICMSVYNWKTGAMVWCESESDEFDDEFEDMGEMEYHTRCHILDSTHVLKISKYDLTVYRTAARGGKTGTLVCDLKMPALGEGFEASYCASSIQRPPETPDCSPHFECDPSLTVLVMEYDVRHESSQQDSAWLVAVIPISTILAQVHGRRRKLSWKDWGARGARLVLVPYQTSYSASIRTLGSRVAVSVSDPSAAPGVDVAVLDVREGVKHAKDGSDAKREETLPFLILDRYTEEDTPIFEGPVEATMPYRMVRTRCDARVSVLCDGLCT